MDKDRTVGQNPPDQYNADSLRPNDNTLPKETTANTSSEKDITSSVSLPCNTSRRMDLPVTTAGSQGNPDPGTSALFSQKPQSTPTLRPIPPPTPRPVLPPWDSYQALISAFPDLERSLVIAIVRHEFNPRDLWQLDRRSCVLQRNKELTSSASTPFAAGAKAISSVTDLQRFPTLTSLLIPLTLYLRVLHMSLLTTHISRLRGIFLHPTAPITSLTYLMSASSSLHVYVAHLADVAEHYEWDAVLAYHMAFHERCRWNMAVAQGQGQEELGCRVWGTSDGELMALYLSRRTKKSTSARDASVKKKRPVTTAERQATLPRIIVTPPISTAMADMCSTAVAKLNESSDAKTDCTGEDRKKNKGKKKKNRK